MRALHSLVVPAKAGTHTPCPIVWVCSPRPSAQQTPVVMGPCFRRDDEGGFNFQTAKTRGFETFIASQRVGAKRRPMTGSAKQSILPRKERKSGLLRYARNDVDRVPHTTSFSRRGAPEALLLPSRPKGVGNAGCPLHPRPRVHLVLVESTRVTTSTPESPGIPARNGFNGFLRALPGDRACLPPSLHGYGFV